MIHGYPQTHLTWHKVAPRLAKNFTVVLTDLRGYGDSAKPDGGGGHVNYSKRAMAHDQVLVMQALGFDSFRLVAHDRGGRVAHRLSLDHAKAVTKMVLLDIAPTATMYARTDMEFARRYWWWFFMIQRAPLPETAFGADPDFFLNTSIAGQIAIDGASDPRVLEEYRRCFRDAATRHAMCEDYRAAATIDLEHDALDADKRVLAPLLVLWGGRGVVGRLYDVVATWREKATDVKGHAIDCGHCPQEEQPDALMQALEDFL
jgi:haloacetate dehalogenase